MPYSDKENVNILTSLLVAHGVAHAIVCPGSRNAPLTHNLCECPAISCVSVTDERSAAFAALGEALALAAPVAVCVTSGSALLNTLPAVAEAYYRHVPLVVISADRPAAMIGQLQGQTIPQADALGRFVLAAVSLPEPHDATARWHCNRLANEALMAMRQRGGGPVHINVPISEPLFDFSAPALPVERVVRPWKPRLDRRSLLLLTDDFSKAERPMVVVGQLPPETVKAVDTGLSSLRGKAVVLREQLAATGSAPCHFDEALALVGDNPDYRPDFVVYLGDTLVSKRVKRFLQGFTPRRTIVVNETGLLTDVTMHATDIVECGAADFVAAMAGTRLEPRPFAGLWESVLDHCRAHCDAFQPAYSQMMAVSRLHEIVNGRQCFLHYGNSSTVRLGQLYSTHYIYVNRGVNGIEGSLSTAVGFASAVTEPVYCVIGDLSFFYDQNALWNGLTKGNLRILLLNNGGGGIFHQLPGLAACPYRDGYVAAAHKASAKGVCEETGVDYKGVESGMQLDGGLGWLTDESAVRPRLLEVFTDPERDAGEMRRYLKA